MPPSSSSNPRRILTAALVSMLLCFGVVSLFAVGFSSSPVIRVVQVIGVFLAGVAVIGGAIGLALVHLGGWRHPRSEREFEALVQRAERLAAGGQWGLETGPEAAPELVAEPELAAEPEAAPELDEFRTLVRGAIEELPLEFHRALEHVAIVISDSGAERLPGAPRGAYGLYQGDTIAHDFFHERIVIFRDTLQRDFGHDPELLRAQIGRTVRHELAHHLGWGEKGVRGLGL
jgi:predicted Zn-dependent protease with MMP-like domain